MKYKIYRKANVQVSTGGQEYWLDKDFYEHLKLTKYQTTYKYFIKNFPPSGKLLDAGCGIGRWIVPLAQANYEVTGLDISEVALNTINSFYQSKNLTLVKGNIFKMDFPDKTFDYILSLGVLEHFEDPSVRGNAIKEHVRVMKDDGVLLITVPYTSCIRILFHAPYLKLLSFVRLLKDKKQKFIRYYYGKVEFSDILEKCGLIVDHIIYDDLLEPYNFGLTIDYPVNLIFRSGDVPFKANKLGNRVFKFLWRIHPGLVSGGIGYVCKKSKFN